MNLTSLTDEIFVEMVPLFPGLTIGESNDQTDRPRLGTGYMLTGFKKTLHESGKRPLNAVPFINSLKMGLEKHGKDWLVGEPKLSVFYEERPGTSPGTVDAMFPSVFAIIYGEPIDKPLVA